MSDLHNITMMLMKSDEEFTKYKSDNNWKVQINRKSICMVFDMDGNFKTIFTN